MILFYVLSYFCALSCAVMAQSSCDPWPMWAPAAALCKPYVICTPPLERVLSRRTTTKKDNDEKEHCNQTTQIENRPTTTTYLYVICTPPLERVLSRRTTMKKNNQLLKECCNQTTQIENPPTTNLFVKGTPFNLVWSRVHVQGTPDKTTNKLYVICAPPLGRVLSCGTTNFFSSLGLI